MHLTYVDILNDKPMTVRMPWIAIADAVASYQVGAQADERECFGPDWFDENGQWIGCHEWTRSGNPEIDANAGWVAPRKYREAFPDFDDAATAEALIQAGWRDKSWHNECCPGFMLGRFLLFVDFVDVSLREIDEQAPRFTLHYDDAGDGSFATDAGSFETLGEALALIAARQIEPAIPDGLRADITDLETGKAWLKVLVDSDLSFHLEDSPATIMRGTSGGWLFRDADCNLISDRVRTLYALAWGEFDCPIGYLLHLEGE